MGLCFAGGDPNRQLFSGTYWDENGKEHSMNSWGMSWNPEAAEGDDAEQWVYLDGGLTGTCGFSRWLPVVTAQQPVTIPLPMDGAD